MACKIARDFSLSAISEPSFEGYQAVVDAEVDVASVVHRATVSNPAVESNGQEGEMLPIGRGAKTRVPINCSP
jgi:hypothetical protein